MRARFLIVLAWLVAMQIQKCTAQSVPAININPMTQVSDTGVYPPGIYFGFNETTLVTNGMYGWTFSLTEPATLTGLGWYDERLDGLSHPHEVGVWQYARGSTNVDGIPYATNAPLLLSVTVPAGTNAVLDGVWRKIDLNTPMVLTTGVYVVAGTHYSLDPDVVKFVSGNIPSGPQRDPRLLIGVPAFSSSGAMPQYYDPNAPLFRIPDNFILVGSGLELGPNLFLVPGAIPGSLPSLEIKIAGSQIVLSWPLWATNFTLEISGALGANASWIAQTNAVSAGFDQFVLTNQTGAASAFYRLRGL